MKIDLRRGFASGVLLGAALLVASPVVAGEARPRAGHAEQRVTVDASHDALTAEIRSTQRVVREALLAAALTPEQMGEAYSLIAVFAKNYANAVQNGDSVLEEMTFEQLFEGKVGEPLRARFALRAGETDFLRDRVLSWSESELVRRATPRAEGGR